MQEDYEDEDDEGLGVAIADEYGQAPWYLSSTLFHATIFLLMLLFIADPIPPKKRDIVITTEFLPEEPPEEPEDEPEITPEPEPEITKVDEVVVEEIVITTTDVEVSDSIQTDDAAETDDSSGDPDNMSTFDSEATGTPAFMGAGASGGGGGGGAIGNRTGGKKRTALRIGGGDRKTEDAVASGLKWLAEHQEANGSWDCDKYEGKNHDAATTGLALLAFLGAGNSMEFGKYKNNVTKGVNYLISLHDGNGRVGPHRYEAPITMLALAEAYGMTSGSGQFKNLQSIVQKQIEYAQRTQNDTGGWDYKPNSERDDLSVTGWWIMALKSAKVAGFDVPKEIMTKSLTHLEEEAYAGGDGYDDGAAWYTPSKTGKKTSAMTAVYLTCAQFLGRPRSNQKVTACAGATLNNLPEANEGHNLYLTYYQCLGLFQMGVKSDYWKTFNPIMKKAITSRQVKKGSIKDKKGSWDPDDTHSGHSWGRCGQTAISVLCLEIYYRYKELEKK